MSNINNLPKRSHSLVHHKQHNNKSKLTDSQQQLLQQKPSLSVSSSIANTTPHRSASVGHQQVRLARSSSLSDHHHKKVTSRDTDQVGYDQE